MLYVESESLREKLDREGRILIAEVVRLTDEIAAALSYAHEQGVVHRRPSGVASVANLTGVSAPVV